MSYHQKAVSIEYLSWLVYQIGPDVSYPEWIRVLMVIHNETNGSAEGFELADMWSSGGHKYRGTEDVRRYWKYIKPNHARPVGIGTLIRMARESNGSN